MGARIASWAVIAGAALVIGVAGGSPLAAQDSSGGSSSVKASAEGKQLFEEICQACHMADAKGSSSGGAVVPALAGNAKLADKDYPITLLLKGRGGMPWFTDILTPEQMAAVITYVRGHFNAYGDGVSAQDVERVSKALKAGAR